MLSKKISTLKKYLENHSTITEFTKVGSHKGITAISDNLNLIAIDPNLTIDLQLLVLGHEVGHISLKNSKKCLSLEEIAQIWSFTFLIDPEEIINHIVSGTNSLMILSDKLYISEEILVEYYYVLKNLFGGFFLLKNYCINLDSLIITDIESGEEYTINRDNTFKTH